ncbi:MAG: cytochrome c-type biogenesis protein CcmH [Alteromonadaceae bacterium]|jgi:cytochrome c-type biogenesis protein CcmH|tara:strand:- start:69 stop:1346 length:1278 start_codon:yes stop_codon:yes gene_type:complete
MIELIITIVVFLLLILVVVWGHFLRSNQTKLAPVENLRDETNVRLYHEHKAEIEKDYQKGNVDEENYQYLLSELEKSLLQDIEQNSEEEQQFQKNKTLMIKPLSILWPVVISLFIFVFSFGFYLKSGGYDQINSQDVVANQQAQQTLNQEQQLKVQIQALQNKIEKNPEDADTWYELGQVLVGAGDFDNAIKAFDRVIEIEGEKADILGAKAQASYYRNGQKLDANVQRLIDRALVLDPVDPSTNILLGMHNFMNQNYQQAINYWQRVVDSGRKTVNIAALKDAIVESKNRLSLTETPSAKQDVESQQGPQLVLNVSLSDEISEKLREGEDKIVFVYAVPVNGTRMPVAAVKIKASDLPTTIILNNARAMSPQATLSSVDEVNIYAVVSKTGGVGIKSGDFKAEKTAVNVNTTKPISLVIDIIVP